MENRYGLRIHINGIVQGVGFRPFVYNLANRLSLKGWVRNTSAGVDIVTEGSKSDLESFLKLLRDETPPLAHIDEFSYEYMEPDGLTTFEIVHSETITDAFQPISPDIGVCPDCLRELFDPSDRRYLYPFINCTNCGPRFTIILDIPYDRPNTSMAGFPMCPECAQEYGDPINRRFHAQPTACPVCGPHIWLEMSGEPVHQPSTPIGRDASTAALRETQRLLAEGKILAIKGLGGFHLACDASNPAAVQELRRRKLRVDKPFALMMPDIATVKEHCYLTQPEEQLLLSHERPIVILRRRPGSRIAVEAAPGQDTLGVMLPYTPLHHLLFSPLEGGLAAPIKTLVMTSGNLSEEPIAIDNEEARQRLKILADAFLLHDRPIRTRCDDSVVRVFHNDKKQGSTLYPLRRSRGYAPFPVRLPWEMPPLLAAGGELKNTFCLTRRHYAFLSQHVGDMENYETYQSFEDSVQHLEQLFRIQPAAVACDLHPNYLSTRYAQERGQREKLPVIEVQHHHAHIAACMAENEIAPDTPVIGIAFDGTGYGEDGMIWGGEFLLAEYKTYQRAYHLNYMPLPGGDAAIRKPGRIAMAYLWKSGLDLDPILPCASGLCADDRTLLRSQLELQINTPLTSSMGRLFDAVAALAGVRQETNYEGQAAIELEALAASDETGLYPFPVPPVDAAGWRISPQGIDLVPCLQAVVDDLTHGVPVSRISARFHNGLAELVLHVSEAIRSAAGTSTVALSGGVWQNMTLLTKTLYRLEQCNFHVLIHKKVPANDGGIALGQAVAAYHKLNS